MSNSVQTPSPAAQPLGAEELRRIDAWWRACNYLSVGMIYLRDNPLLKQALTVEHVKHRLLGHWGASPALSFVWAHLNRLIKRDDLDVIFVAGPGHGAPGVLGPAYLEGTYSEIYPDKSADEEGLAKFFKQFSFPGHIGSHVTPETPGSIHEGGELGYSLSHAYGMAFDNPELIVACVVGDGRRDRPAGHRLALEQVHQSDARRRRAADSQSQRLQDRQPDDPGAHQPRRAGSAVRRLWLHAVFRRGLGPGADAPEDGRHSRPLAAIATATSLRAAVSK
jgi:hypothetical protein